MPNEEGIIEEGKKRAKKNIDIKLHGLWGEDIATPLKPEVGNLHCNASLIFQDSTLNYQSTNQ